jgi:hypothetical protein
MTGSVKEARAFKINVIDSNKGATAGPAAEWGAFGVPRKFFVQFVLL